MSRTYEWIVLVLVFAQSLISQQIRVVIEWHYEYRLEVLNDYLGHSHKKHPQTYALHCL